MIKIEENFMIKKIEKREKQIYILNSLSVVPRGGSKVDGDLVRMLDPVSMKSTSFLTINFAHLRGIYVGWPLARLGLRVAAGRWRL